MSGLTAAAVAVTVAVAVAVAVAIAPVQSQQQPKPGVEETRGSVRPVGSQAELVGRPAVLVLAMTPVRRLPTRLLGLVRDQKLKEQGREERERGEQERWCM